MRVNILYNKKGSIDEIYTPPTQTNENEKRANIHIKLNYANFYYIIYED